jgi:hypothetical protein
MPEFLRLLRYALPHKGKLCLAILAMFLVALLSAVSTFFYQPAEGSTGSVGAFG